MTNRRHFIAGLLATGLVPAPTWADAGGPSYLAAAGLSDGSFSLCGIDRNLDIVFQLPLPAMRRRLIQPGRKPSPLPDAPAILPWSSTAFPVR